LDLLFRFIAMGAAHNSGEVFRDLACHPGTRVAVLEQLSRWASGARPESMILWLRGPPGVGKSAIAQMFAGMCHKDERLGGSFFFKSGHPERGSWDRVFITLAYDLAHSVPGLRLLVQEAVEIDNSALE
ncbi:hypothetical protein B0H13DRAFT_1519167, partial [Mycena leptocephala]